jgi:SAM-dependent methyltransferase
MEGKERMTSAEDKTEIPIAQTIAAYDEQAPELAARYAKTDMERFFRWHAEFLPEPPGPVLDIGAGSGVLADAFAKRGYEVAATEPSSGMAKESLRLFPSNGVLFFGEALPSLSILKATTGPYKVVVCDAVWMHVPPSDRPEAWESLAELTDDGGILTMAVRYGPHPPGRPMHEVDIEAFVAEATANGFTEIKRSTPKPMDDQDDGSGFVRVCFRKG